MQSSEAERTRETVECHITMAVIANSLITATLVDLMHAETSAVLRSGNILGPHYRRSISVYVKVHARGDNLGYIGYAS
jgi:hypothetical protein